MTDWFTSKIPVPGQNCHCIPYANFFSCNLLLVTCLKGAWDQFPTWSEEVPHPQPPTHTHTYTHPKQHSNKSWVSYNLNQFWHCLPGDSIRSYKSKAQSHKSAPPQTPITSLGWYLCFWLAIYQWFPWPPSSGLINFLEQLIELEKTVSWLDYPFIITEDIIGYEWTFRRRNI